MNHYERTIIVRQAEIDFFEGRDSKSDNPHDRYSEQWRLWDETSFDLWKENRLKFDKTREVDQRI